MGMLRPSGRERSREDSRHLRATLLSMALVALVVVVRALLSRPQVVRMGAIGSGCSYTLENTGKLTIYPTDGVSGEMARIYDKGRPEGQGIDCEAVRSIDVRAGVRAPRDASRLFVGLSNMESANLSALDTSGAMNMDGMFGACSSLTSIDLSSWDTSQVTNMSNMFGECVSLTSIDFSGWDTSRVTEMRGMFSNCFSLASLDLSGWDTSRVTDMGYMFYVCPSLASLDLSGWDTSRVTDMEHMFSSCSSLRSLNLSGWDASKAADMENMLRSHSSPSSPAPPD